MNEPRESRSLSEDALHRVLRELPPRRAPATLAPRVLREIERRRAQPWWRRGFTLWPLGARAAFLASCGALIALTAQSGAWEFAARAMAWAGAPSMAWMHPLLAASAAVAELTSWLLRVVPAPFVYGALAAGTMLYVALFGLGAAAYRMLYLQPSTPGERPS
jgi:hypothetical protein